MFLILFRRYIPPLELLDLLIERFEYAESLLDGSIVQLRYQNHYTHFNLLVNRVCNILVDWMSDFWVDFYHEKLRFTISYFLDMFKDHAILSLFNARLLNLSNQEPCSIYIAYAFDWADTMDVMPLDRIDTIQSIPDILTRKESEQTQRSSVLGSLKRMTNTPSFSSLFSESKKLSSSQLSLSQLKEASEFEIAQQLNLMEFELFRKIDARDILHFIWSKSRKGMHVGSVTANIQHFNFIARWYVHTFHLFNDFTIRITSAILNEGSAKHRARAMAKFIRMGAILEQSRNYNTLMALLAGLNSSSITRLKHTRALFEGIPEYKVYIRLEALMSSEKSFVEYRNALKSGAIPCIPYLGLVFRDMLYIDEGNKDKLPDASVNMYKFVQIGDILLAIQSFQLRGYPGERNPAIMDMLTTCETMDDDQMYNRSLSLEPRDG